MLNFSCDYLDGAHPKVLEAVAKANFVKTGCYNVGDAFCDEATAKIRALCEAPEAEVHYLGGGTQANMTVLSTLLRPWEGVIAARTGHIACHEAGGIEASGHKVMEIESRDGKLSARDISRAASAWEQDGNREHMIAPGAVYITFPTEYGTLYSLRELEAISAACREHGLRLYVDGARIFYGLSARGNDVTLADIARLADAFYIGGTKCGLLFGEAVVFPRPGIVPHFYTLTKQYGALYAKSKVLGAMFGALLEDGLGFELARAADREADRIREALRAKGYELVHEGPTNQVFVVMENARAEELMRRVAISFWEQRDESRTVYRLATSWSTESAEVDQLIEAL